MNARRKAVVPGKTSTQSNWADHWTEAFEQSPSFSDDVLRAGARLNRGQAFEDVEIAPGLISARIEQRSVTYTAQIGVRVLDDLAWQQFSDRLLGQPAYAVALLLGELPSELVDEELAGISLVPQTDGLFPDCSCGDWNGLCAHAAALLYATSELIEADPFVLTTLRGRGRYELKSAVEVARTNRAGASKPVVSGRPRGEDAGVSAAAAFRRTLRPLPNARRLPLSVGEPLAVTVLPPVDSGVTVDDLHRLVEAASERAARLLGLEQ